MTRQNERLNRQEQRLNSQNHRMYKSNGIDHMQGKPPNRTNVWIGERVVIVGIGVGDATASRRHAIEPSRIKWLQKDRQGARLGRLLNVDELIRRAQLS